MLQAPEVLREERAVERGVEHVPQEEIERDEEDSTGSSHSSEDDDDDDSSDLETVKARATVHQHFRQEYYVRDTLEDAAVRMKQMFDLAPGQFLDFSFNPSLGCYVFVNDPTKLDSTQFTTSAKINGFMGGTHYFHNAFFPDMDSIRKGIVVMAEAEQWSWTKKQDFRIIQKQFDEFIGVYPFIGQCRFYNSGLVFNMMAAILRRVLPTKQLRDQFKTLHEIHCHSISLADMKPK
ncbi:expressed unknown protein [Seminavis robusta]|uniref:Uncharacterized protein n=1 Tax=Seminavis robusta TaxID=568900 RepID=A0A9N8DM14_9STRA|nr:expressed unknown protein [Seminavis robusta]|eukprot:Sro158_g071720.1 n/a (235) ;mRNA; f:99686-100594